ncbi:MAG: hypothetical protein PVI30_10145 [Myxococcales bacterium]
MTHVLTMFLLFGALPVPGAASTARPWARGDHLQGARPDAATVDPFGLFAPPDKDGKPKPPPPKIPPGKVPAPDEPGAKDPKALRCELKTKRAPRGGRIEVVGDNLGKTPLVKIGGRVARIIERRGREIAVQVHRDSNGGPVTVKSGKKEARCGSLTIIGKD